MQIGVLGPLTVVDDRGQPVRLAGELQRRLLAILASRVGTPVTADVLADALWGEDLPANPPAALHSQVARLRRSLPDDGVVSTDGPGYRLDLDPPVVDARAFEDLLAMADGEDRPERVVAVLDEAIELWRGDAYGEFLDIEMLRYEAYRYEELALVARERRADAQLAAGRSDVAIADLEQLIAAHPFRERPVATLMRSLDAVGRQGDALRAFATYRSRLADELGLEPSAALRDLERHILGPPEDQSEPIGSPRAQSAPSPAAPTLEQMTVEYVPSGRDPDIRLAVGRVGSGSPLVAVPAWVTSLPVIAASRDPRSAVLERLAAEHEVISYDQPGTGLTGGSVADFSTACGVRDLRAVIEHTVDAPVILFAASMAGPAAIALAAEHPHLVDRLVLFGTYADPALVFPEREVSDALVRIVRSRWGMGSSMIAQLFRPEASEEGADRLASVLRESAPADVGAGYLAACYQADVSDLLPQVTRPCLVLHYRGDRVIPFAGGEHLAAALPDAQFVPLDGRYHLPDLGDVERVVRTVRRFVAPARA